MTITLEAIRAAGGIVHSDGNIFFRDISMLQGLAGAAPAAVSPFGYVNTYTGQFLFDVEPCRKDHEGHWRTVYLQPAAVAPQGGYPPLPEHDASSIGIGLLWGRDKMHSYFDLGRQPATAAPALEAPAAPVLHDIDAGVEVMAWLRENRAPHSIYSKMSACLFGDPDKPRAAMAAAPQAPNCTRCSGSGEDPEGYLTHGRGPDDHTVDGPCRSCDGTGAAPQAPAAPVAAAIPDAAYCALQYVEHALAAIANREELADGAFQPMDSIGKASKRANAALARLQSVAHHFSAAAAPAAPSVLPSGWVPCILTHDGQHPEEVAYGPQIMMDRLKKWLGRYFELLAQKVIDEPVHAEMLAALQAVAVDVVHVGAGENVISDAARAKVEAVLEKIGAPWPSPAAAPAAPAVDASDVELLDFLQQTATAVEVLAQEEGEPPRFLVNRAISKDVRSAIRMASGKALAAQAKEGGAQ